MKLKCIQVFIWILLRIFSVRSFNPIHFPSNEFSFCTTRFNGTSKLGYERSAIYVKGIIVIVEDENHLERILSEDSIAHIILVLSSYLFTDKRLMTLIINCERVVGVLVFSPSKQLTMERRYIFSEETKCTNSDIKNCLSYERSLYTDGYLNYNWKIPVVLLLDKSNLFDTINDCYIKYNRNRSYTGQKCSLQINNYVHYVQSYKECSSFYKSWRYRFILAYKIDYCKKYLGFHIYQTFNDVLYYKHKSIILILTKTDTVSMFDTGATGSQELYPTVSSLIYMANIFHKAAKEKMIDANSDILLAFLDNIDANNMGGIKFIYDLKMNRISNSKQNISELNIKLVLYIGELFNHKNTLTIITKSCETNKICSDFRNILIKSASFYDIKLRNLNVYYTGSTFQLLTYFSAPYIIIIANILSRNFYKYSFMDKEKPKDIDYLENVTNTIAMSVLELIKSKNSKNISNIMRPSGISAKDLTLCIYNLSCESFDKIIGPEERWMYQTVANPFVAQSYVNEIFSFKGTKYFNRLSFFILKLLVVLYNKPLPTMTRCKDFKNIKYFEMLLNDHVYCFNAQIQVENNFYVPKNIIKEKNLSFTPILKRVSLYKTQSVTMYMSDDADILNALIIFNTIFVAICILGSFFIYRNLDNLIIPELF